MEISINLDSVEVIKADLRHKLPQVKSSHRAEAIARGLGWRKNASLLVALANGSANCTPDPKAFSAFLAERGCSASGC